MGIIVNETEMFQEWLSKLKKKDNPKQSTTAMLGRSTLNPFDNLSIVVPIISNKIAPDKYINPFIF